jgi:hypothetical protein
MLGSLSLLAYNDMYGMLATAAAIFVPAFMLLTRGSPQQLIE